MAYDFIFLYQTMKKNRKMQKDRKRRIFFIESKILMVKLGKNCLVFQLWSASSGPPKCFLLFEWNANGCHREITCRLPIIVNRDHYPYISIIIPMNQSFVLKFSYHILLAKCWKNIPFWLCSSFSNKICSTLSSPPSKNQQSRGYLHTNFICSIRTIVYLLHIYIYFVEIHNKICIVNTAI